MTNNIATTSKNQGHPADIFPTAVSGSDASLGILGKLPSTFSLYESFHSDFQRLNIAREVLVSLSEDKSEEQAKQDASVLKWQLQHGLRAFLPSGNSTSFCFRNRARGTSHVAVNYSPRHDRCTYGNLQRCKKVWSCPVCSSYIAETRRREVLSCFEGFKSQSEGCISFCTFTFPHKWDQSLLHMLSLQQEAEARFKSGRRWRELASLYGVEGTIRALEAQFGLSGWHPHTHMVIFHSRPLSDADLSSFQADLFRLWSSICLRAGLVSEEQALSDDFRQHGVKVERGDKASEYVSKWGLADELTKGYLKKGRKGSFSPYGILQVAVLSKDPVARKIARSLFLQFMEAFKGRRQLVWSPGLADRFQVEIASDDLASLPDASDEALENLALLTDLAWSFIVNSEQRGQLLQVAKLGRPALVSFLLCQCKGRTEEELLA
jgi:hypothetical protein